MSKLLIEVKNIEKKYFTRKKTIVPAIKNISFRAFEGEFWSIVGPSGGGKTTLLRIMAGILEPTNGKVYLRGEPVIGPNRGIGMIFQSPILLEWRNVIDNVMLPVEVLGLDEKTYRTKALDLLKLVDLAGFEDRFPNELSSGMQARVALCRALIHNPFLLLMDEPFGTLDAMTRDDMNLELMKVWSKTKKTILFVTHDIQEAVFLADHVLVLSGRPARVVDIVKVDLPRPRKLMTKASKKYLTLTQRIRKKIGE